MGGCALTDHKKHALISLQAPSIYSIDYKSTSIIKYSQSGIIERYSLSCLPHLPKFSAYTYTSPHLYIVGGSDPEFPLRNDCISLNLNELFLDYYPSLPLLSKHGDLYSHFDSLYYLGGVQILNYSAAPTPFMRLCKDSSAWEYLSENAKPGTALNICSQLLRPGSCKIENCLYIIGGEFVKQPGMKTFSSTVYCFDLDTLTLNTMEYKGVEVIAPRCVASSGGILVLGGYDQHSFNYDIWTVGRNFARIGEQRVKVGGNKGVFKIAGCFVVVGNNKVKKLREDRMTWKVEDIRKGEVRVIGDVSRVVAVKKNPETPGKRSIYPQYFEETEKSSNNEFRVESRKMSPSNLFNSQLDFDYSQTFQVLPHKELSEINSIIENYDINN